MPNHPQRLQRRVLLQLVLQIKTDSQLYCTSSEYELPKLYNHVRDSIVQLLIFGPAPTTDNGSNIVGGFTSLGWLCVSCFGHNLSQTESSIIRKNCACKATHEHYSCTLTSRCLNFQHQLLNSNNYHQHYSCTLTSRCLDF